MRGGEYLRSRTVNWKHIVSGLYAGVMLIVLLLLYRASPMIGSTLLDHRSALCFAVLVYVLALTVQTQNFLKLLRTKLTIPFSKALRTWALGQLANYLGPLQPGLAVRFLFFKRHGVSTSVILSATLQQIHLSLWVATGAFAAATLLIGSELLQLLGGLCILVFLAWPMVVTFLRQLLLAIPLSHRLNHYSKPIAPLLSAPPLALLPWFSLQYILGTLLISVVYASFGANLTVGEALLIATTVYASSLVALLPNNLGLQDAVYGAFAYSGGLDLDTALSIILLLRIAHVLACGLLVIAIPRAR